MISQTFRPLSGALGFDCRSPRSLLEPLREPETVVRVRFSCLVFATALVMSFTSGADAQSLPERNQLANALRRAAQDNDNPKMLQLQRLIVESDEIRYGQNYPKFAEQLVRLGSLLRIADNYSEAETRFKRAIEIYERNRPPDILDLALAYREITQLYSQSLGRYADAEQILLRNQAMLGEGIRPATPTYRDCAQRPRKPLLRSETIRRRRTVFRTLAGYQRASVPPERSRSRDTVS